MTFDFAAEIALSLGLTRREAHAEFDKGLIKCALMLEHGNATKAAKRLGEHRNTIASAMHRWAIQAYKPEPKERKRSY